MAEAKWYVAHTYSGYENKVKANIEKTVDNRHLEDQILEVQVPLEEVLETKNGVTKTVKRKKFPGYVLIRMVMNDDTWYVVRNTRGVTGFVGPGSKPVPLTLDEQIKLGIVGQGGTDGEPEIAVEYEKGDLVIVTSGAWAGTESKITAVNPQKQTVSISVNLFGRETPVEISFADIRKR
ncbi:MAG: transcription termination/antitermination protein NusG [Lachnospiraceae bacterium]|nr:transcription termination/antitermination protein NusG [Lachnospiraceae bacterium]